MNFADMAALQLSKQIAAYSAILYDVQAATSIVGILSDGAQIEAILHFVFVGLLSWVVDLLRPKSKTRSVDFEISFL